MNRIDYRRVFREVYEPPRSEVVKLDVPPRRMLALDGEGPPRGPAFGEAVHAVRVLAHALRKHLQAGPMALDFRVMPLEVAWQTPQHWTVFIFQAPVVEAGLVSAVQQALARKRALPALARITLSHFPQIAALQTLHLGDLDSAPTALTRLETFAAAQGLVLAQGYHAIDLGDPRRSPFSGGKALIRRQIIPTSG